MNSNITITNFIEHILYIRYSSKSVHVKSLFFKCFSLFHITFIYLFTLFLTTLDLRCFVQAFSSCGELGLLFVVILSFLIVLDSLVAEHRF